MTEVKEAIKYGIETLKVSPDRMFSLIESSREYEGTDYPRWLAKKIIDIAEKNGVGYSQILVKKFDIIQDLLEEGESESKIREEFLVLLVSGRDNLYTVGLSENIGVSLDDIDWYREVDFGLGEMPFFYEELPEVVRKSVMDTHQFNLCVRLSGKDFSKKTNLVKESKKELGSYCKTKGSLMLYRMCMLADTLQELDIEVAFSFIADSDFVCDKDNKSVIKRLLECYTCKAVAVKTSDLYDNPMLGGKKLLVNCQQRKYRDGFIKGIQPCISAKSVKINDDGSLQEVGLSKIYSRVDTQYIDYLESSLKTTEESIVVKDGGKYELVKGAKGIAYLQYTHGLKIVNTPIKGEKCLPITEENFWDVAVYYGVSKALSGIGQFSCIPQIISGHSKVRELAYNCLPILLFDPDTRLFNGSVQINGISTTIESRLCYLGTGFTEKLLSDGGTYFSFEAKELCDICAGYVKFVKENTLDQDCKTFSELRTEADNRNLDEAYLQALLNLKDYVSSLYRSIQ